MENPYAISEFEWVSWSKGDHIPWCWDCEFYKKICVDKVPCLNCAAIGAPSGRLYFKGKEQPQCSNGQ
jgi:hypothetical protein